MSNTNRRANDFTTRLEANSDWRLKEIGDMDALSSQLIARDLGMKLSAVRSELAKAERAGLVKGYVARCSGNGRRGTRQVFNCKFWYVA